MKLKKIIIFLSLLFILLFSFFTNYKVKEKTKNALNYQKINKKIFKNRLLDDVIDTFKVKFYNSKFEISDFNYQETSSKYYFYSQIFNYKEAYFMIEYDEFEIKKLELNFSHIDNTKIEDVIEIISILIQISDSNISIENAKKIILNMILEFEKNIFTTSLVYENDLIYTLSLNSNNTIIFTIK